MEQAESNLDSLRVFTTEKWFVQLDMAAAWIACCSKCGGCSQDAAPDPAGMDRRTGAAMRLLPKRYDDRRGAVARQEPESNGGSNQGCFHQHPAVTPPVPLRHLLRHHRCRATRRHRDARGKPGASITPGIKASSELPAASVTTLTPPPITPRRFVTLRGALFVSLSIPAG